MAVNVITTTTFVKRLIEIALHSGRKLRTASCSASFDHSIF